MPFFTLHWSRRLFTAEGIAVFQTDHTTNILHKFRQYFSVYFIKYSQYRKQFQTNLYHVFSEIYFVCELLVRQTFPIEFQIKFVRIAG